VWLAADQIKKRRETEGLTQDDLASLLGITKSYVSQIEAGKRAPTPEHALILAQRLNLPLDGLLTNANRLPSDVMDVDATTATIAIRSAKEQTLVEYPSSPATVPSGGKRRQSTSAGKIAPLIHVNKTTSVYRAHSYHTKVPPAAITPFIEAFTKANDVVMDSFCGSGMTGVAARSTGRRSLLSDLSPAAVHIAWNYNTYCDPGQLASAVERVASSIAPTMAWLYTPVGQDGEVIEYTTWSDVFACPRCSGEIVYWESRSNSLEHIRCPSCGSSSVKADLKWVREVPVETHVSKPGKRMQSHAPTKQELDLIKEVDDADIVQWTPQTAFGPDREMWRAAHGAMGIKTAADFYTKRNLYALAELRHAIKQEPDARLRAAMAFAFTAAVNRASKRYQWNEKRPTNVMTGTLYISSLRYEWNVWSLFKRKAADVIRYYQSFASGPEAQVFQRSATDLSCLEDKSVDMAFVDPPFGSNIYYADSSLLWDAWLGSLTDQTFEIVVNQRRHTSIGGKDIDGYGSLLTQSLSEIHRVLRPGGRSVVAFSNSNDKVWEALQDAISDGGFNVSSVHILDKGQPSIKGVKGQLGKEFVTRLDLTLSLEKKASRNVHERAVVTPAFVQSAVRQAVKSGETRSDHIYASVLRDALQSNLIVQGITMPEIERLRAVEQKDSQGTVSPSARDITKDYLTSKPLPASTNADSVDKSMAGRLVAGSRGSPLYLAHSYHTKVPPESIRPFIEHFSKPGDVVLDPFCGSGMTGVAASMAGRRSILNDLSPAAVHLAWNHTRPLDPVELETGFATLESRVSEALGDLYSTTDEHGAPATIRWTVWSTRHECPACKAEFNLWDVVDKESGRIGRSTQCPKCGHEGDRRRFPARDSFPVWVAFQRQNGSLGEKPATEEDVRKALEVQVPETLWAPANPIGSDREMYLRCALHLQGIRNVADFYTRRNLKALAIIWREIMTVTDLRLQKALIFAFTNTAWHGTRMRRFNARGGHRPMTGTLYVPQLSSEANVLQVMKNKISQLRSYYQAFQPRIEQPPAISIGSATNLKKVKSGSVDYVFTDPPFGSNIFYADCNLVWESWLGRVTDATMEAVVNKSLSGDAGGKSLSQYGDLMSQAMGEISRVLKPGGWATVVFHNTDKEVWRAISDAAAAAGLEFHEASSLDRKQQSHKGYKGRSGSEDVAHYDVVMNLRKPMGVKRTGRRNRTPLDVASLVAAARAIPEVAERGIQGVHAEVMRRLVSLGVHDFPDFSEVREAYERRAA
jgi:DNA modification methylase/transcriptional regulator with XRE-family HTH domain/predicted RNA-binding Zn-ribbon protein involved in translation (DUF1610 family)